MSERIQVHEDTFAELAALKAEDESFDDLLARLLEARRERVLAGAGRWDGTDAPEAAREARDRAKRAIGSRRDR